MNQPRSNRKGNWIIGLVMAALTLCLIAGVIYLLNLKENEPDPRHEPEPVFVQNPPPKDNPTPKEEPVQAKADGGGLEDKPPVKADGVQPVPQGGGLVVVDQAEFFGTRARGKRFCIIADASNSMKGAQMLQLKKEILETLYNLSSSSQFYVIFFNATDLPMPHPTWLQGEKANVDKVKPWIEGMGTILKTEPMSSFERAFKLEPKPDVIFFMTDGLMAKTVPANVAKLNKHEPRVTIHTIMFTKATTKKAKVGAAEDQLRTIAEQSGGTYRHVTGK